MIKFNADMKIKNTLKLLFVAVFMVACGSSNQTTANKKASTKIYKPKVDYSFKQQPNKLYFNILQLNDVYEISPIQGGEYGGMARVETVHKELLKETPNTMIVLAGDFLNPSLLGTMKVDGERVKGKQMVDVMNAMNFDLVAFGNHEFDLSYNQLQDRINESNFDWVSANVLHNKNGQAHYFHKVKYGKKETLFDSYVKDFYDGEKSLKIGFVSVCINSNPRSYVTYSDALIEIERSYNEVKNQADIVLGLTHLEIEQDRKVAKLLPNIPLIMGGHEHTNNYETIGDVRIAKADANAKTVYIHRFEYDPITKKLTMRSELRAIDKTIPEDEEVAKVVGKWEKVLKEKIQDIVQNPYQVIYRAKTPLDARDTPVRSTQTNMGRLITKSMDYAFNNEADCVFFNGGSIRLDDVLKGDINAVDVFRVLPYGGSIYKVQIKGSLLRNVLEYGNNAKGTGAYLQRYNCDKVEGKWQIQNQPIQNDKIYTVITSDYLLKGFDIPILKEGVLGVTNVYKPNQDELGYDIRRAIITYLKTLP